MMIKKVMLLSAVAIVGLNAQTRLDTSVITATGFENILKDEVRNVSVVTKEDIQNQGYESVQEILEKIPSVTFVDPGFGQTIDVRGQGPKANSSVKVLLNGIKINLLDTAHSVVPIEMIAIEDIERIEVIQGGGAVLYGSGTAGGVVNIITKQKPREFYGNIRAKGGSYNYKNLNFGLGGLINEKLFLRANGNILDKKGYRRGDTTKGQYGAFGLNYQITDNQSLSLNPSFYSSKDNSTGSLTKAQLDDDRRQAGSPNPEIKNDRYDVSLDYSLRVNENYELNLMPYYQKTKNKFKTGAYFLDKKLGANLKNKFDYGSGALIAGYEYLKNDGERFSQMGPMGSVFLDLKKNTHSLYFLEKHDFNSWLSLSGGYRFEYAKYDVHRNTQLVMMGQSMSSSVNTTKNMKNHAFEFTPNFKYSDTGNVYMKYERGFISPSPTQLTDKVPVVGGAPGQAVYRTNNLKPEVYNTFEVGVKDLILDQFASLTLFYSQTKDEISVIMPSGMGIVWNYVNIDKTRRIGLEAYSEQALFDNKLKFSETFSLIDAKITKGKNKDKKVSLVPRYKFIFGAGYEVFNDFKILGDIKHFGKAEDNSYGKIPEYTVADFGLSYKFNFGLGLMGGVKNVFDKKYNLYQNKKADSYSPAAGRNFYLEAKYAF